MKISNENFSRAWKKSRESQFYNRSVAFFFVLGIFTGLALGYFAYSKVITDQKVEIDRLVRVIEVIS